MEHRIIQKTARKGLDRIVKRFARTTCNVRKAASFSKKSIASVMPISDEGDDPPPDPKTEEDDGDCFDDDLDLSLEPGLESEVNKAAELYTSRFEDEESIDPEVYCVSASDDYYTSYDSIADSEYTGLFYKDLACMEDEKYEEYLLEMIKPGIVSFETELSFDVSTQIRYIEQLSKVRERLLLNADAEDLLTEFYRQAA